MRVFQITAVAASLALAPAVAAGAASVEEKNCKFYPKGGLLKSSYELVGAEACKAACSETDGCTAWSYLPHNFRPKKGPGYCRLMAEVGEEKPDKREFCGRI